MDLRALLAPDPGPSLGESRMRVLDLLRAASSPLGVHEIADRTGLHTNTARFHLDGLVDAGLAERAAEARTQPGRPRAVYVAAQASGTTGRRSYHLLAEILGGLVGDGLAEPVKAAVEAGLWGRYLTQRPAPFQHLDADLAIERLTETLREIGFAPEIAGAGQQRRILLRHCPFREVAQHHPDVVCRVHLGLMQGALAEMRVPVTADRPDPFVEPSLCMAHLNTGDSACGDAGGSGSPSDCDAAHPGDADAHGDTRDDARRP